MVGDPGQRRSDQARARQPINEVLGHATGLLAGELAGWSGLPGEAEAATCIP